MTTVEQVQTMVDEYCRWLKDETTLKSVAKGEWVEITTPMLDRHNDPLFRSTSITTTTAGHSPTTLLP